MIIPAFSAITRDRLRGPERQRALARHHLAGLEKVIRDEARDGGISSATWAAYVSARQRAEESRRPSSTSTTMTPAPRRLNN